MAPRGRGTGRGRGRGRGGSQGGRNEPRMSNFERETRIRQLRDQLYPHVTSRDVLVVFLEANNWDVERAHARWERYRNPGDNSDDDDSDSDSDSSLSSSSSLSSVSEDGVEGDADNASRRSNVGQHVNLRETISQAPLPRPSANIEQERRDAAYAFRCQIEADHNVVLSISEAVLLLLMAGWDMGMALTEWVAFENSRDRLRVEFDGMRDNTDNVNEQSARVQTLLDITERADWLSMKIFLQKKQWDLVRAVVAWYKFGIRPFTPDDVRDVKKDRAHWALRVDSQGRLRQKPSPQDCEPAPAVHTQDWSSDPADFTVPGASAVIKPKRHGDSHGRDFNTNRDREPGFIIHAGPNVPIKPGPADPAKFLLEYISRGRYRYSLFAHKKYFFSDRFDEVEVDDDEGEEDESSGIQTQVEGNTTLEDVTADTGPDPSGPRQPFVEFDFGTQSHLHDLNAWRRQIRCRVEGDSLSRGAQQWTEEELEFFYQLNQEWYEKFKALHPTWTRQRVLDESPISTETKNDWADRMNSRFRDTIPTGAKKARWDRAPSALITHRGRDPRVCIHFRVKPDPRMWKKLSAAERTRLEAERDQLERADAVATAIALNEQAAQKAEDEDMGQDEDTGGAMETDGPEQDAEGEVDDGQ